MSKSILLSIKPKWVAKILNGEKTIEVRKVVPKCDLPIDVYIYCTKDKGKLVFDWETEQYQIFYENECNCEDNLNGKVVAKFTVRKVEEIKKFPLSFKDSNLYRTSTIDFDEFEKISCLSQQELDNYLKGKQGYAYHIEDLVIFDKPKELWKFTTPSNFERYKKAYHEAVKIDCEIGTRIAEGCAFDDEIDNAVELLEMTKFSYGLTKAPQSMCYVESEE